MKKLSKILLLSVLSIFLVAGSAMAYPNIEVEGLVNPWTGTTWTDNGNETTTIEGVAYIFNLTTADFDAKMKGLNLEFEGDVFLSVTNLTWDSPADWSASLVTSSFGNMYEITSGGTTLGQGESLIFHVDLTLYTEALTNISGDFDGDPTTTEAWTEGQIWAQSWLAFDTLNGGDGGSTAPIPEPATMLLFGAGLIGIAAFGRKKLFK